MNPVTLAEVCKEAGLSVGVFALCAYITIFIVKRLSASIDKLVSRMEVFTSRVRREHDDSSKEHEKLMEHHEEIVKMIGRINGYKP